MKKIIILVSAIICSMSIYAHNDVHNEKKHTHHNGSECVCSHCAETAPIEKNVEEHNSVVKDSESQDYWTTERCPRCYGSGQCPVCKGMGRIQDLFSMDTRPCNACSGTGKCSKCGGSGQVKKLVRE